jgi:hypothetical protein
MALEIPDDWSKDHRKHRKQTRIFALLITLVIWGIYPLLPNPIAHGGGGPVIFVADRWSCLPFAGIFAYALALLIVLFRSNAHRMVAVLRPNIGRLFGSFILAILTPIVFVGWLPMTIGFFSIPAFILGHLWGMKILGVAMLGWYLPTCLLISGIKDRFLRFGGFCLMYWAYSSALILISGTHELV